MSRMFFLAAALALAATPAHAESSFSLDTAYQAIIDNSNVKSALAREPDVAEAGRRHDPTLAVRGGRSN
jgi:hypothetical protein